MDFSMPFSLWKVSPYQFSGSLGRVPRSLESMRIKKEKFITLINLLIKYLPTDINAFNVSFAL